MVTQSDTKQRKKDQKTGVSNTRCPVHFEVVGKHDICT
jgi:hypothetical protein